MSRANEIVSGAKESDKDILVLAIDLKGMRQINNTYGRTEGDKMIGYVAQSINEIMTQSEIAMRKGN